MEKQPSNFLAEISDSDWEKTPESVKRLVGQLLERLAALEERQEHLEEQLQQFTVAAILIIEKHVITQVAGSMALGEHSEAQSGQ